MNNLTIKDIARISGVSTATVSRVLNNSGYVSDEVKEKVLKVVKELNYRPNAIARSLKTHKTNTIGIVIPDISNPYFMRISKGIEDTIEKKGYILIFVSSNENPDKEIKALKTLFENRVDAIVVATSEDNDDTIRMIETIKNTGTPIVLVDRKLRNASKDFNIVVENNFKGAYKLTKHLIELGHRKIGVINGLLRVSTGMERYLGFKKAIEDYGLKENPDHVFNGNFTIIDGKNAVNHFWNQIQRPTAILSFNNMMTFGAILQLHKMGLSIPKDITVASYGETEVEQLFEGSGMISLKQSPYEMGIKVGEILIEKLINGKKKTVCTTFDPRLNI